MKRAWPTAAALRGIIDPVMTSGWILLSIPVCLAVLALVLAGTAWLEQSVLSSRSLVLHSLRSSRANPDHVEVLVANQYQQILDTIAGRPSRSGATEDVVVPIVE